MNDNQVRLAMDAWKQTVEVQEHFNDLEMRVRNFALTVLLAVFAAAGFALKDGSSALAVLILVAGLVALAGFYLMDEHWYHRLLVGAVVHGIELEEQLQDHVPGIGLTIAIKNESAIHIGGAKKKSDKGEDESGWALRSHHKIRIFYGLIALALVVLIIAVTVFHLSFPVSAEG